MAGGLEVAPQADVCWLAEGYASQRDMALAIKAAYPDILLLVSHRDDRQEILGCGDIALREPRDEEERAAFIEEVIRRHAVTLLHAGRRGRCRAARSLVRKPPRAWNRWGCGFRREPAAKRTSCWLITSSSFRH
ncbi:hypothetical protein [uncultured Desulfovibrio sp.]|uniref:hypothetical protein n=1 Tax=uncultured Desulfovibrio sp. TaxID=167968 RepID=UPI00263787E6|nr:hypothetical protein [uncultured Desulfovibrio sp.]